MKSNKLAEQPSRNSRAVYHGTPLGASDRGKRGVAGEASEIDIDAVNSQVPRSRLRG